MKFHGAEISILRECAAKKKTHNATTEISRRATESVLGQGVASVYT